MVCDFMPAQKDCKDLMLCIVAKIAENSAKTFSAISRDVTMEEC